MEKVDVDKVTGHVKLQYDIRVIEDLPLIGDDTPASALARIKKEVMPGMSVEMGGTTRDKSLCSNQGEDFRAEVKIVNYKSTPYWFKIMLDDKERKEFSECPKTVSSEILELFRKQIEHNHGQTLEQLNERGGLDPTEIYAAANFGSPREFNYVSLKDAVGFLIKINKQ